MLQAQEQIDLTIQCEDGELQVETKLKESTKEILCYIVFCFIKTILKESDKFQWFSLVQAHQLILAVASPFLKQLFQVGPHLSEFGLILGQLKTWVKKFPPILNSPDSIETFLSGRERETRARSTCCPSTSRGEQLFLNFLCECSVP